MRVPRIIIPLLVALALLGGFSLRVAFTQPTLTKVFAEKAGEQATFLVDGIRCRGTANLFVSLYEETPGVFSIQTFASEHKAVFTFDPAFISRDEIRAIMDAPIEFEDGTTLKVFKCVSAP